MSFTIKVVMLGSRIHCIMLLTDDQVFYDIFFSLNDKFTCVCTKNVYDEFFFDMFKRCCLPP